MRLPVASWQPPARVASNPAPPWRPWPAAPAPTGHGRKGARVTTASYLSGLPALPEYPPWLDPCLRDLLRTRLNRAMPCSTFFGEESDRRVSGGWQSRVSLTRSPDATSASEINDHPLPAQAQACVPATGQSLV